MATLTRAPVCPFCGGSGLALFVQSLDDYAMRGPYRCQGEAWQALTDMAIEEQKHIAHYHLVGSVCPDCGASIKPAASRQIDRLQAVLPDPGFEQFKGCSWESFPDDPDKEKGLRAMRHIARNNAIQDKTGLVLSGDCGVGKTGLAYLAYQERKPNATWVDYNEMIGLIQDTYGKPGSDTMAIIQALGNVPVLFVDDLGDKARSMPVSDDRRDKTYDVLRRRHQKKLLTVITTNLTRQQLTNQFGNRISSRIEELCLWITVGGKSLRHA